jgi:hypothetical protein
MIQRSRFFKTVSWVCIALAVNVCAYEIVLGAGSQSARPSPDVTASRAISGGAEAYYEESCIQLAQSDTTGVSVKSGSIETSRIRFVRLPGREDLGALWQRERRRQSSVADNSGGVEERAVASRVWLLPGREGPITPGTRHWRNLTPEPDQPNGEVPLRLVADGPLPGEERQEQPRPVYGKWWFWAVGVVAVGTATALLMRTDEADRHVPRKELPDFPGPPDS